MRGGNLEESSCLTLQLGSPPPRTTELPRTDLFALVRSPDGEDLISAPADEGYFVVFLTLDARASTANVTVTSTTAGKPKHRTWRLAAPAWLELVIGFRPSDSVPSELQGA
jgi:hypothetical protein